MFDCATWLHKARSLPKDEFKQEIEQAIETAALMLGTDKSRGYCLEMICADFLAGANLENEDPTVSPPLTIRRGKVPTSSR